MGAPRTIRLALFCLLLHSCRSVVIFARGGQLVEEEKLVQAFDTERRGLEQSALTSSVEATDSSNIDSTYEEINVLEPTKLTSLDLGGLDSSQENSQEEHIDQKRFSIEPTDKADSSSSEESKSHEHQDRSESSNSGSNSSSEEEKQTKKTKRSLDSKQESINALENGSNTKENQTQDNKETTVVGTTAETTEPTTKDDLGITTTISQSETTTDMEQTTETTKQTDVTEKTTGTDVTETTTGTTQTTEEVQFTASETQPKATRVEIETTTATEIETTEMDQGNISETKPTTTESEAVLTSTTESEAVLTSTTEASGNSDKESEEDDSSSSDNKETTEAEPSKPPPTSEENQRTLFVQVATARVNRLSDQIRLVLQNYRITNVVVIPGQTFFPDPMPLENFDKSFSVGTMNFRNMFCYGLSDFTVEQVNTDVDRMQVYVLVHMKRLVILGNYTLRTIFSKSAGPFNVTLLGVDSEGVAEVATAPEGHLEATDSQMDMNTREMKTNFRNMGTFFQSVVGTVGDALFNSIKPQILERINVIIRTDVNKKLKDFSTKFINKVAPVDLAFSEGRKYVRTHGYDPYNIKDHSFLIGGLVNVNITDFYVEGLSKFYRVGNLSLAMDQGAIEIGAHVLTQKLTGRCVWSGQTFGILKSGRTNFTVDHLQVRALVTQSLDVRKKPQLKDLDLELGWVKVTIDSPLTLNFMIEGVINAFPRLIRHIIVDTLEQPLKEKIQEILNEINVESIVDEHLPRLDSFGL